MPGAFVDEMHEFHVIQASPGHVLHLRGQFRVAEVGHFLCRGIRCQSLDADREQQGHVRRWWPFGRVGPNLIGHVLAVGKDLGGNGRCGWRDGRRAFLPRLRGGGRRRDETADPPSYIRGQVKERLQNAAAPSSSAVSCSIAAAA